MPKISIVVPVYNVEKCLCQCLDSIMIQKFADWECILINDGSSDGSGKICDEYEQKDKRFKVIHKDNAGPSVARNAGIECANGQYVCFVDSDDWMEPLCLYHLIENEINDVPSLIVAGFVKENAKGPSIHKHIEEVFYEESFHEMFEKRVFCFEGYPFSKLYDRQIIMNNGIRFNPKAKFGEDLIFCLSYILCVKCVKFISNAEYHYSNANPTSLVRSYHSFEEEYAGYCAYANVIDLCEKKYSMSADELFSTKKWLVHFAMRAIKTIYRYGKNRKKSEERISILSKSFSDQDKLLFYNIKAYLPLLDKIICSLIISDRIVMLDKILSIFFYFRYNTLLCKIKSLFS